MTTALSPSDARPSADVTAMKNTQRSSVAWSTMALAVLTSVFALFAVMLIPDTATPTDSPRPGPAATTTAEHPPRASQR